VISKVVLATKALATDIARKRPFIGVSSFVYHQVVGLGELAVTRAADELLSMSAHAPIHKYRYNFKVDQNTAHIIQLEPLNNRAHNMHILPPTSTTEAPNK